LYHGKHNQPIERGLAGHKLYPADQSSIGNVLMAVNNPELAHIREQGWAWVVPSKTGIGGSLAVPVGDPVLAGLAIVPQDKSTFHMLIPRLLAAGKAVTEALLAVRRDQAQKRSNEQN
jgi:hypothetical protein